MMMIARVLLWMTGNLKARLWKQRCGDDGGDQRESVLSDPHTTCQSTSFSSLVDNPLLLH